MTRAGQAGHEDWHRQIVSVLPRLRRFCLALTRQADAADDLCQAAVERALARADKFADGSKLDSWMYKIAQNIWIDEGRKRQTRGHQVDVDEVVDLIGADGLRVVEGRSDLQAARQAFASLPEDQRTLVTLVVLDGMSYKDAAATLDIPIGTVMSRIARARRSLDRQINGETVQ